MAKQKRHITRSNTAQAGYDPYGGRDWAPRPTALASSGAVGRGAGSLSPSLEVHTREESNYAAWEARQHGAHVQEHELRLDLPELRRVRVHTQGSAAQQQAPEYEPELPGSPESGELPNPDREVGLPFPLSVFPAPLSCLQRTHPSRIMPAARPRYVQIRLMERWRMQRTPHRIGRCSPGRLG